MIRGYVTSQMRWDKSEYVKGENAPYSGGELVERSSSRVRRIDPRCLLRAARRLMPECERRGQSGSR